MTRCDTCGNPVHVLDAHTPHQHGCHHHNCNCDLVYCPDCCPCKQGEPRMTGPRVLGLDLSITATGIAFPGGTTHTLHPHTNSDRRLVEIVNDLYIPIADADLVVIEGPVVRSNAAVTIGMVHGAIRTLLLKNKMPYAIIPPATLKKYATGRGNATKPDMRMALYKRTGLDLPDDNQVDAWWLQAAGMHHLGHPAVNLPKAQVDVLEKIKWP